MIKGWGCDREKVRYCNRGEWDAMRRAFPELANPDGQTMTYRGITLKLCESLPGPEHETSTLPGQTVL